MQTDAYDRSLNVTIHNLVLPFSAHCHRCDGSQRVRAFYKIKNHPDDPGMPCPNCAHDGRFFYRQASREDLDRIRSSPDWTENERLLIYHINYLEVQMREMLRSSDEKQD